MVITIDNNSRMIRNINVSNNVENIPQLSNIVPMNNNQCFFVIYLFILKNEIQLFLIFNLIISIVEKQICKIHLELWICSSWDNKPIFRSWEFDSQQQQHILVKFLVFSTRTFEKYFVSISFKYDMYVVVAFFFLV